VLLIHQSLGNVIYYLRNGIKSTEWNILQYCCMDHKYAPGNNGFDWQFYIDSNPDLTFTSESEAVAHWESVGRIQGRNPEAKLVPNISNNTLAFAITSEVYEAIKQNLDLIISARPEVQIGIFDFQKDNTKYPKFMTIPNLFVRPKIGKTIAQSLRWYMTNYDF
jgi:hypothetical protein